ncbi:MAG: hypothetical protein QOH58_3076 [Thermoleophilaceae bacterium]|nr:hypothetical protein [Thermoleophilaceae bacterium]
MRTGRIGLAATLAIAAISLAGCGLGGDDEGSSDREAVEQVMSDLETASREGDGERICGQIFTPKLADSVTTAATSGSCAAEVKDKLFSPDAKIDVQNIDVPDDANATATVKEANGNTSTIFLVKQSGRWRIRSVAPA